MNEANTTQTDPTAPTAGFCGCGCGQPVARRYKPGHDARHHSILARMVASGNWRSATRAADMLAELGWTKYADRAALRAVPYRTTRGQAAQHIDEVARFQVDSANVHHADRRCPALTAQARRDGTLNRTTKLAGSAAVEMVGATDALRASLRQSWDQCTTCTTDETRDEAAERAELAAARAA